MSKKQKIDPDYFLALTLQRKFNEEYKKEKNEKSHNSSVFDPQPSCSNNSTPSPVRKKPMSSLHKLPSSSSPRLPPSSTPSKPVSSQSLSLNDSQWEVIDPTPDVHGLFVGFGRRFFQDRLGSVEVKWSKRMTSCAGVCRFKGRRDRFGRGIGEVTISLSEPLLKLRPRSDLVNTLLHEMIHAYLFLFTENPNRADRDDHGQEFQMHMHRINREAGTKITIYHSFHDEVKLYKQHWWQCNGPCKSRHPFYGLVKRATNRAPGKSDFWYANHQAECGGQFIKIKEPENFKARPRKNKENAGGSIVSPAGGQLRAITGKTGTMGGPGTAGPASKIHGFGKPNNNGGGKHLPIPGQPKIVGFVDLNKTPTHSPGSGRNVPVGNKFGTGATGNTASGGVLGRSNVGTTSSTGVGANGQGKSRFFGGGVLGSKGNATTSGNISGTRPRDDSNGQDGYYKLGTPLNKNLPRSSSGTPRNPNGTLGSPTSNNRSGNSGNSGVGTSGRTSSGPVPPRIGSKLLDKLNFDSKNNNGRTNSSNGNTNRSDASRSTSANNRNSNVPSSRSDATSNRTTSNIRGTGHGGGMGGGTRMNKGTGTLVVNANRTNTTAAPSETAQRIAKPINKAQPPENRLNIDHFKPFMGQGQTLGGGGTVAAGGSRVVEERGSGNIPPASRLLRDSVPVTSRLLRDNEPGGNDGGRNKKVCLGDRSVYSNPPPQSSSREPNARPSNDSNPWGKSPSSKSSKPSSDQSNNTSSSFKSPSSRHDSSKNSPDKSKTRHSSGNGSNSSSRNNSPRRSSSSRDVSNRNSRPNSPKRSNSFHNSSNDSSPKRSSSRDVSRSNKDSRHNSPRNATKGSNSNSRNSSPKRSSSSGGMCQSRPSTSSNGAKTPRKRLDLSWDLRDEEIEDTEYEYEKVNSSFRDNDANESDLNTAINLNDSFEEMEKMMNDEDVDVFGNISDDILSGRVVGTDRSVFHGDDDRINEEEGISEFFGRNEEGLDDTVFHRANESGEEFHGNIRGVNHGDNASNLSLEDMFEMSSDEGEDVKDSGDDETHCPVCNRPIARASMNDHLENCFELSQVFDNVVIDEEEDEDFDEDLSRDESTREKTDPARSELDGAPGNDESSRSRNESMREKDDITRAEDESGRSEYDNARSRDDTSRRTNESRSKTHSDVSPTERQDASSKKVHSKTHRDNESKTEKQSNANRGSKASTSSNLERVLSGIPRDASCSKPSPDSNRQHASKEERNDKANRIDVDGGVIDLTNATDADGPELRKVKCPICNSDMFESLANEHIDECLARNIMQEMD